MNEDVIVLFIIAIGLLFFIIFKLKNWLFGVRLPDLRHAEKPTGEAVTLLKRGGYEVIAGKLRVPLRILVNEKEMKSRYFIDYLAKKDGKLYIVKLSRERQPMKWTGSAVRDHLFPYVFLFDHIEGILYVDVDKKSINRIVFEFDSV